MIWLNLIKQHLFINTQKTFYPPHLTTLLKILEILKDQIGILKTGSLGYLPSYALLKIWNNLPLDLKRSALLGIFKKGLFEMLSDAYISKCNKPSSYSCKK